MRYSIYHKNANPENPGEMSFSSLSETSFKRHPKRRSVAFRMAEAIYNHEKYGDPLPDKEDLKMARAPRSIKSKLRKSNSVVSD